MDYISYIRSKVGHDKVILNFAGGILADEEGRCASAVARR